MLDIVKEQGFLAKIYAKGSQENLIKFLEFSSIDLYRDNNPWYSTLFL